jgi:hypothetical protein
MSGKRPDEEEETSNRSSSNQERPHISRQRSQKIDFKCVDSDIIRCVCACIVSQIQKSEACGYETDWEYTAFDDSKFCPSFVSIDDVQALFSVIHSESQMEYECMIVVLIYIERLARASNHSVRICSKNWKLVVCTCMMLASKIWDDFSMINRDFAYIIGEKNGLVKLSLPKLNLLEVLLLKLFNFNVEISADEYKNYHAVVQTLIRSAKTKTTPNFHLIPLVSVMSSDAGDDEDTSSRVITTDRSWNDPSERPQDQSDGDAVASISLSQGIAADRSRSQSVPVISTKTIPYHDAIRDQENQHPNTQRRSDQKGTGVGQFPDETISRRASFHALVWRRASGLIKRVFSREDSWGSARVHASDDDPDSQSGTPLGGSPIISTRMSLNDHLVVQ